MPTRSYSATAPVVFSASTPSPAERLPRWAKRRNASRSSASPSPRRRHGRRTASEPTHPIAVSSPRDGRLTQRPAISSPSQTMHQRDGVLGLGEVVGVPRLERRPASSPSGRRMPLPERLNTTSASSTANGRGSEASGQAAARARLRSSLHLVGRADDSPSPPRPASADAPRRPRRRRTGSGHRPCNAPAARSPPRRASSCNASLASGSHAPVDRSPLGRSPRASGRRRSLSGSAVAVRPRAARSRRIEGSVREPRARHPALSPPRSPWDPTIAR